MLGISYDYACLGNTGPRMELQAWVMLNVKPGSSLNFMHGPCQKINFGPGLNFMHGPSQNVSLGLSINFRRGSGKTVNLVLV